MDNLFDNITPSFGPFQNLFMHWGGIVIAAVWAFGFVVTVIVLILTIVGILRARKQHRADGETELARLGWPIGVLIGLVLIPTIYGVVINSARQTPPPSASPSASST